MVIVANTGWNIIRFRGGLLCALVRRGWRVTAVADFNDDEMSAVRAWGGEPIRLVVEGSSMNPLKDLRYFLALRRIYKSKRPDVIHHFTVKPVIYGSMAAKSCQPLKIINSVTGLGISFSGKRKFLGAVIKVLYRKALSGNVHIVFQNRDDREHFLRRRLVRAEQTSVIVGSGVDTDALTPAKRVDDRARTAFVMVSRMLWSKGVGDFVEAARFVKQVHPDARFILIGGSKDDYGSKNPDFVPRQWLEAINREGVVEWLGWQEPAVVERWMKQAAAVVLPSYYPEGVPRCLIEGAAAGVPLVTTDTPGCRDTVIDGVSGFLCPPHAPQALASAMRRLRENRSLISRMGREGRKLVVERFDERNVLARYFELYEAS